MMDMTFSGEHPFLLFRESGSGPKIDGVFPDADDETEVQPSDAEEYYLCVGCKGRITGRASETFVDGAHLHTFANPMGIVFEIGCYREAFGCAVAGPASDDFTWFKGYFWKIAYCRYCSIHLGWQFVNTGGDHFFGLISDRIMLGKFEAE